MKELVMNKFNNNFSKGALNGLTKSAVVESHHS